jgi:Tfp pilus assembly PilM family ATPase/Tfp pilus assembly protein PilN
MLGLNFKKFNLLSGIANKELLGIDFSNNYLKVIHAKSSVNTLEINSIANRDIKGLSDTDISRLINSTCSGFKSKNMTIMSVIPSHLVITRNIEIPSTDPKEIREIINLQAGRHTPYSREEIIIDYIDIGTYKNNYTRILLVIVERNIAKRQFDVMDRAGFRLDKVFFAPEGIASFISGMLKLSSQDAPVDIIHIDDSFTDFIIAFKEKVVFVRSIPIGTQQLVMEKERYLMRFVEELKRSLEAYHSEDIEKSPNMLVLTGAVSELKELENILNNTLHFPIKTVSYFKNLAISEGALRIADSNRGISFLNVIAPIFGWQKMKVNFVPEEVKLRLSLEERGRDLIKTGIFILAIFILFFFILISKVYFKNTYLKYLTTKYDSLNQQAQELERDFTKMSLVKSYLLSRGYSLEVLTELYNLAPLEIQLEDIRFDEQGKFSIKGTAESMSVVFAFVDSMEKSKYFRDVKTKYTSKRKDGNRDVADFEIACLLKKETER